MRNVGFLRVRAVAASFLTKSLQTDAVAFAELFSAHASLCLVAVFLW
jgi:deoxyribodipyrimidine photolyase